MQKLRYLFPLIAHTEKKTFHQSFCKYIVWAIAQLSIINRNVIKYDKLPNNGKI